MLLLLNWGNMTRTKIKHYKKNILKRYKTLQKNQEDSILKNKMLTFPFFEKWSIILQLRLKNVMLNKVHGDCRGSANYNFTKILTGTYYKKIGTQTLQYIPKILIYVYAISFHLVEKHLKNKKNKSIWMVSDWKIKYNSLV